MADEDAVLCLGPPLIRGGLSSAMMMIFAHRFPQYGRP